MSSPTYVYIVSSDHNTSTTYGIDLIPSHTIHGVFHDVTLAFVCTRKQWSFTFSENCCAEEDEEDLQRAPWRLPAEVEDPKSLGWNCKPIRKYDNEHGFVCGDHGMIIQKRRHHGDWWSVTVERHEILMRGDGDVKVEVKVEGKAEVKKQDEDGEEVKLEIKDEPAVEVGHRVEAPKRKEKRRRNW